MQQTADKSKTFAKEHFIPLRKFDLVKLLAGRGELSSRDQEQFRQLCRILEAVFHFEYHERLEDLKNSYAPFDPDSDTRLIEELSEEERDDRIDALFDRFTSLLERANFRRLTREDLERVLQITGVWQVRLDVDFDLFDKLEVYARGDSVDRIRRRRWQNLYRTEELEVPVYQRLVVMFRFRDHRRRPRGTDTKTVFIKLFKNIPHMDLEILLPGARVKMTMVDRVKIAFPTLAGIALTIFKIVAKGVVLISLGTISGALALLGLVGGLIGYGVKSFFGFLRTKEKYQLNLTRNLYYQNLDNNAGVLFRLLDDAEEQEFREAILAYFLLWKSAPAGGWTLDELDQQAETYITEVVGFDVDFEVDDAVEKLVRLGLIAENNVEKLRAVPIDEALRRLDEQWDNYFPHNSVDSPASPPHTLQFRTLKSQSG